MTTKRIRYIAAGIICLTTEVRVWAQAPRVATLDIEWQNAVVYIDDLTDTSKLVSSANPVAPTTRNFMPFLGIGDIVSVNGEAAKGSWVDGGRLVQIVRSPLPGQAIGDLALRGGMVDIHLEILQTDGTPVGSIMTSGFTGGGAPPGVSGLCCNLAVTGGTGAFQGVRGTLAGDLTLSFRPTSMAEDPANRRMNGGARTFFRIPDPNGVARDHEYSWRTGGRTRERLDPGDSC